MKNTQDNQQNTTNPISHVEFAKKMAEIVARIKERSDWQPGEMPHYLIPDRD